MEDVFVCKWCRLLCFSTAEVTTKGDPRRTLPKSQITTLIYDLTPLIDLILWSFFFCWPLVTSSCLLLFVGCELGIRNPLEVEVAQKKYVYIKSISSPTLLTRFWSNLLYDIYLWKNVPSPGSISTAPLPHTFCPPSGTSVPRKWKKNYMISI